ncbi:MAG: sulfate adenylyltransferase subunit CysN [Acidobacteriaceae bacterium]
MQPQANRASAGHSFEQFLSQHLERDLLRFTTAGSVDDGKSTLIGRLLYDSKAIYEDQLQSIQQSKLNRSTGPLDFSLLTDGLRAEREQGITIDVAYRYFTTARRKFIIADTPGHEQYTRNMATGASTADAAVVLVDARKGVLPQSRRHATIAALLGIPHIIAAVNKMDLVDYSEEVFRRVEADLQELALQISPSGAQTIHCIPISALEGENVVTRSAKIPWYTGPSLLEYLEEIPIADANSPEAFRFPVQYVIRPDDSFRGFAGQIVAGSVRPGDRVVALPSKQKTRVRSIVTFDGPLSQAGTGSSITLQLENELDLSRGDLLVSEEGLPNISRKFAANVVWLHDTPLDLQKRWIMRQSTDEVRVQAVKIRSRIDVNTMERPLASQLGLNDIGIVEFEATRHLAFDLYSQNRNSGSFILIDPLTNATVGAGMITENLEKAKQRAGHDVAGAGKAAETSPIASVAISERVRRSGHHPGAVWLGDRSSLAAPLERALFEAGLHVVVIDDVQNPGEWSEGLVRGLYSAGMIVLYSSHQGVEKKKALLTATIRSDRILDVSALSKDADDARLLQEIVAWVEGLRIARSEEGR